MSSDTKKIRWFSFLPVDTLFFRGAKPTFLGEQHTTDFVFPPVPQTFEGAIRTSLIYNFFDSIENFEKNEHEGKESELKKFVGTLGGKPGFSVIGPVFKKQGCYFLPAPFLWYFRKKKNNPKIINFFTATRIEDSRLDRMLKTSTGEIFWVKSDDRSSSSELENAGGYWVSLEVLKKYKENPKSLSNLDVLLMEKKSENVRIEDNGFYLFDSSVFFKIEPHTGLMLETDKKRAKDHHLYTFNHIRLEREVEIVFGINRPELVKYLKEIDFLFLGGERRFGRLAPDSDSQKLSFLFEETPKTGLYMTLSLLKNDEVQSNSLVATGRIHYRGGFDFYRGFHKPLVGYFPQGSVFKEKVGSSMINL